MKISIGNDHAGTDYKFAIVKLLESKGIQVENYGTDSFDSVLINNLEYESYDYILNSGLKKGREIPAYIGGGENRTLVLGKLHKSAYMLSALIFYCSPCCKAPHLKRADFF